MDHGFVVKLSPGEAVKASWGEVSFRPVQTIGPLTVGESAGKVALTTVTSLGEEWLLIIPIALYFLPFVIWILSAAIWWWASSDLKFADVSKIIGVLFGSGLGVVTEALVK